MHYVIDGLCFIC